MAALVDVFSSFDNDISLSAQNASTVVGESGGLWQHDADERQKFLTCAVERIPSGLPTQSITHIALCFISVLPLLSQPQKPSTPSDCCSVGVGSVWRGGWGDARVSVRVRLSVQV